LWGKLAFVNIYLRQIDRRKKDLNPVKWTSYLDIQIPEMVDYALDTGDQT